VNNAEISREITVSKGEAGERIDRYLAARTGVSRTRIKRAVETGDVLVNGSAVNPNYRLKTGDVVTIARVERESPPAAVPEDIEINVVYEDDHLMVVDKPAGMVVHPAPGHYGGTLYNAILFRLREEIARGEAGPGIVHRLDKDTSGLIIVAKTASVKENLSERIKRREVERIYRAIVWGHLRELEGTIEAGIGRHPQDRKRMSVYARKKREASTRYEVLESFSVCDYVRVRLQTGRTHQIRVHFSSLGHPIVGDETYGGGRGREAGFMGEGRKAARKILELIDRQALHAHELSFVHPVTGKRMEFTSPLPRDMQDVLDYLRRAYDGVPP